MEGNLWIKTAIEKKRLLFLCFRIRLPYTKRDFRARNNCIARNYWLLLFQGVKYQNWFLKREAVPLLCWFVSPVFYFPELACLEKNLKDAEYKDGHALLLLILKVCCCCCTWKLCDCVACAL